MKAELTVRVHDEVYYAIVKGRRKDQALLLFYAPIRKRRATAIADGLKFADAHNITITNRKEFET